MPKPPGIHIFDQVKFITNYMLAGCGPEADMIFELQTDAAENLLWLLLGLDAQDIVQGFFDPRRGRNTKPGRHGRKRPGRFNFPDISDEIGKRASVPEVGRAFQKLPGGRYVLPGINMAEGVAIFAIVTEGIADITFDNVMGIIRMNPEHCRQFPRFQRTVEPGQPLILAGGGFSAFQIRNLNHAYLMATNMYSATCTDGPWALAVSVTILSSGSEGAQFNCALQIYSNVRGEVYNSGIRSLDTGEVSEFAGSATAAEGEFLSWHIEIRGGVGTVIGGMAVGYGESDWLDWVPEF